MSVPYNRGFKYGVAKARYGFKTPLNPYDRWTKDHDEWEQGFADGFDDYEYSHGDQP